MRVFHREHAGRPVRVVWMLEELGADYEVTLFTRADALTDEHRERHPLGRVPVLETDGRFVFESAERRGLPLVVTLGGGYARPLARSVSAHLGTYRAARTVYGD